MELFDLRHHGKSQDTLKPAHPGNRTVNAAPDTGPAKPLSEYLINRDFKAPFPSSRERRGI